MFALASMATLIRYGSNHEPGSPMIPVGEALVTVTLIVLAQRGRFRQTMAWIGVIVGAVILVAARIWFESLLPI